MLVVRLVGADGVVARPLAVVQALAERERALVDGGSDRHAAIYARAMRRIMVRCRRSLDALRIVSQYRLRACRSSTVQLASIPRFQHSAFADRHALRRHRHRRRPQRPGQRRLPRARRPQGARARAPPRARRRRGDRGDLPRLQVLGLLLRRLAAAAGDHPRARPAAARPGDPAARRHVHADAERRLPLARQRPREDAARDRAPLARSTPRPTTSTARRWSRWAASSSRSST